MSEHNTQAAAGIQIDQINEQLTLPILTPNKQAPTLQSTSSSSSSSTANATNVDNVLAPNIQQTTILTSSGTMTITSTTAPITPHPMLDLQTESQIIIAPINSIENQSNDLQLDVQASQTIVSSELTSPQMQASPISTLNSNELLTTDAIATASTSVKLDETDDMSNSSMISPSTINANAAATAIPLAPMSTTPVVPKERKRRIIIDDDDESPTFNPLARNNKKMRGKNRRSRQGLLRQKQKQLMLSPSKLARENAVFTSPEGIVSRKIFFYRFC